ncbi:GFA family protein [Algihabitans albus]|uniref:GFA family protein n=1 Tax=Algihabitans albus TaxID=2164067 RepID=UPI001ABD0514|nr:GFA family protein [Algihabitans albus]
MEKRKSAAKRAAKPRVYAGGCLCGAIRFEAEGPVERPHTCSCKMCQRHAGALTAAWVEFPEAAVRWVGPGGAPSLYRSSDASSRAFCPTCGSSLGAIDDAPVVALLLGVFDSNTRKELMPRADAYRGGRPRWWHLETKS